MSEEKSDQLKIFGEADAQRLLAEINFQTIAELEMREAPALPTTIQKEQEDTYKGVSDHSSFVEQLGEKEVERDTYKKQVAELKFDAKQLEFNERFDLHELRREYTPKLFWMVVGWLVFVATMVVLSAANILPLSNAALIALITTTTATVVGMFIIAARWLFPAPPSTNSKKKKPK